MRMVIQLKRSGATVIELLFYMVLLAVLVTASVSLLFSLAELFNQYRVKQVLFTSSVGLLDRVLLEVREGESFDVDQSIVGSSTAASIVFDNGAQERRIVWSQANGTVTLQSAGETHKLHHPAVNVTAMTVYHYNVSGQDFVRVALTLSATSRGYTESLFLSGGAVVRSTYANP